MNTIGLDTVQSTTAGSESSSLPSMHVEASEHVFVEPFADVRGLDENITIKSSEYVPEDMITYWFNQNTVFEGNEQLAAKILEGGKSPGLNVPKLHAWISSNKSADRGYNWHSPGSQAVLCSNQSMG